MPRLRPPGGGRQAAAVVREPDEPDLQSEENQDSLSGSENTGQQGLSEDSNASLKAQIAALEKSNREFQERAEAERVAKTEALKRVQEREAEFGKLQEQTVNSQQEAIDAALAAVEIEAESAQREIEQALAIADGKALGEAQRKMSRAEARRIALENGKEALEREIKERPKPVEIKPEPVDPLENVNIPNLAKQWLRSHPDYLNDARKNSKLQALHWDVVDEGYQPYSQEYFERVEQRLGLRPEPHLEDDDDMEDEPQPVVRKKPVVSAPPSREVPEGNTGRVPRKVTLSAAEKEAARISGVSDEEYAKNKLKLLQAKADGYYTGGQ